MAIASKTLYLRLSSELYDQLRMAAFKKNQNMTKFAQDIFQRAIKESDIKEVEKPDIKEERVIAADFAKNAKE
jgi:hypothetical protein